MDNKESDIASLISARRTIHHFKPEPVPDQDFIKHAIETACWAPNHHLTEPWHFYLLGQETITSICELNKQILMATKGVEAAESKYKRWMNIPGWVIVTCQTSSDEIRAREDYAACCCAIQNFMLCLAEKGVGSKWSTGLVTREQRFYDVAWINPELEQVVGLVWYGYAEETPQAVRKPVLQVLTELP